MTLEKFAGLLFLVNLLCCSKLTSSFNIPATDIETNKTVVDGDSNHGVLIEDTSALNQQLANATIHLSDDWVSHIFTLEPKGYMTVLEIKNLIPKHHPDIYIHNLGYTPIENWWNYGLFYIYDPTWISKLYKDESRTVHFPETKHFMTRVAVRNLSNKRAFFWANRVPQPDSGAVYGKFVEFGFAFDIDAVAILRKVIIAGAGQVPYVGGALSEIYEVFWPEDSEKVDPWEQIKDRVKAEIKESQMLTIFAIMENDVKPLKRRIDNVMKEVNNKDPSVHLSYMQLSSYLIGFEDKFKFTTLGLDNKKANSAVLPLYTRVINLKIAFYTWGITFAKEIKLTNHEKKKIEEYRKNVILEAVKHIQLISNDVYEVDYRDCRAEEMFNCLMKSRTHATINGLKYIPYWMELLEPGKIKIEENAISAYSNYFGRASLELFRQATVGYLKLPLTPYAYAQRTMKWVTIRSVELFACWADKETICSGKIHWTHGEYATYLGSRNQPTTKTWMLDLNNSRIKKMEVGGNGAIDYIVFHTTDGRQLKAGKNFKANDKAVFQMENHYIASFFMSNDLPFLNSQAANIAVSYAMNSIDDRLKILQKP